MTTKQARKILIESLDDSPHYRAEFLQVCQQQSGYPAITFGRAIRKAWQFFSDENNSDRPIEIKRKDLISLKVAIDEFQKVAIEKADIEKNQVRLEGRLGTFCVSFRYDAIPEQYRESFSKWFGPRAMEPNELNEWANDYGLFIGSLSGPTSTTILQKGIEWAKLHLEFSNKEWAKLQLEYNKKEWAKRALKFDKKGWAKKGYSNNEWVKLHSEFSNKEWAKLDLGFDKKEWAKRVEFDKSLEARIRLADEMLSLNQGNETELPPIDSTLSAANYVILLHELGILEHLKTKFSELSAKKLGELCGLITGRKTDYFREALNSAKPDETRAFTKPGRLKVESQLVRLGIEKQGKKGKH